MAVLLSPHEIVAELLKIPEISIDYQDKNGMTALHFAAKTGRSTVATLLLKHGANFQLVDLSGKLPLAYAANSEVCNVIRGSRFYDDSTCLHTSLHTVY